MTHTRKPLKPGVDIECGCEVTIDGLVFCPLHAAAPELLRCLKWVMAAKMDYGEPLNEVDYQDFEDTIAKAEPK